MTLNDIMAIILHYFAEFGSFRGQLRKGKGKGKGKRGFI